LKVGDVRVDDTDGCLGAGAIDFQAEVRGVCAHCGRAVFEEVGTDEEASPEEFFSAMIDESPSLVNMRGDGWCKEMQLL
jgi:hypothetical protein